MEKIRETVTVTTQEGKVQVFEVIEDAERFSGRRAYVQGSTQYYAMEVFERGLASGKAAKVERVSAGALDSPARLKAARAYADALIARGRV